jgi:hypothetical protein
MSMQRKRPNKLTEGDVSFNPTARQRECHRELGRAAVACAAGEAGH